MGSISPIDMLIPNHLWDIDHANPTKLVVLKRLKILKGKKEIITKREKGHADTYHTYQWIRNCIGGLAD